MVCVGRGLKLPEIKCKLCFSNAWISEYQFEKVTRDSPSQRLNMKMQHFKHGRLHTGVVEISRDLRTRAKLFLRPPAKQLRGVDIALRIRVRYQALRQRA